MAGDSRKTKIIFTVGPKSQSEDRLTEIIKTGADICRINMAHANHEWTQLIIQRIRKVCKELGKEIAIMMDIKGPEIRTGDVQSPIELKEGEAFDLLVKGNSLENYEPGIRCVTVNYPDLHRDVKVGDSLIVDSGLLKMEVSEVLGDRVRCRVLIPGPLGSRRHINLPGVRVALPALTNKDIEDIALGLEENVAYYALSFVRDAKDIDYFRKHLGKHRSCAQIIAKIEEQAGLADIENIIEVSDGLMVARGDLGIECPMEELPVIQRRVVQTCIERKKPVIIATHLLESMIQFPVPTRAEISDIASAIYQKADAIMLSGETTSGKYPVECVDVMSKTALRIEEDMGENKIEKIDLNTMKARILRSGVLLGQSLEKAAIVVFTKSGKSARILSALRCSKTPIFAFTNDLVTLRQLVLLWGVEPFLIDFDEDPNKTVKTAFQCLLKSQFVNVEKGDWMVVIGNSIAGDQIIDTVQMRQID